MATAGMKAEVITQRLNVRSGPGVNFAVITIVNRGTILDVVERQNDWVKVRVGSAEGFVSAPLVQIKTGKVVTGFLSDQPELLELELIPEKQIPTEGLAGAELSTARTWNSYGHFMNELADLLDVPVNALVAVLVAESNGNCFASDGRMIIRFENHIFYKYWGEKNQAAFNRYFAFDTSSKANNWKGHKWRANVEGEWVSFHGKQSMEWQVLSFARTLDDTAALMSISMGAPQIMGFNYKLIGYESVQAMFDKFSRSAHAQLLAMFDLVKGPNATSQAIQALQRGDYLTFASMYNGPANAQTYENLIEQRVGIFDRLIKKAVVTPRPDIHTRGPQDAQPSTPETPPPAAEPVTPPAQPETPPAQPTPPATPPVVVTAPPPPSSQEPVLVSTIEGLNVRSEPVVKPNNVIEKLHKNEPVALLEPLDQALPKIAQGERGQQFLKIRTDEGRVGYAAAWMLERSTALTRTDIDAYIDRVPDQFPIPPAYEALWEMQDKLGLPDRFDSLPIQIRTETRLVNMQINGFGPNTFALNNWQNFYSRVGGMHNGHDFIVELGTPLLAVSDGVIVKKWPFMGNPMEKTVVLWCFLPERFKDAQGRRMMSNVLVAYAHMSDNNIKKELDVVKAGEVIGISGRPAGASSNDHLHMEVHLLTGDTQLVTPRSRKLLSYYDRPQPFDNKTPWNPLLFYTPRLIKYQLYQGKTIGFSGRAAYPDAVTLRTRGAGHLPALDYFSLAYYEYGIPVVWLNSGRPWPRGVVTTDMLPERIKSFTPFEPYPAKFLS